MMGAGMMGGGMGAFGFLGFATWLVWLAVGILLCMWLWKKINKE
jgi:hypothetical protein